MPTSPVGQVVSRGAGGCFNTEDHNRCIELTCYDKPFTSHRFRAKVNRFLFKLRPKKKKKKKIICIELHKAPLLSDVDLLVAKELELGPAAGLNHMLLVL